MPLSANSKTSNPSTDFGVLIAGKPQEAATTGHTVPAHAMASFEQCRQVVIAPATHHVPDVPSGRDVAQRIPAHEDEVRQSAGLDRAEVVARAERHGGTGGDRS